MIKKKLIFIVNIYEKYQKEMDDNNIFIRLWIFVIIFIVIGLLCLIDYGKIY